MVDERPEAVRNKHRDEKRGKMRLERHAAQIMFVSDPRQKILDIALRRGSGNGTPFSMLIM